MLTDINPENLFIFDIETVPDKAHYGELSEQLQKLWEHKAGRFKKENEDVNEFYFNRAGIYAEFGKVICVCCGYFLNKGTGYQLKIKTFKNHDEKALLIEFSELLNKLIQHKIYHLCGHNVREFDVPWLCRRMLIQNIPLPFILDLYGKKPWEVSHIDTLDLWKFGDNKHYTSLNLLAHILNIPTPKENMDGSMVGEIYWKENDIDRIATYCGKDVVAVAQLIMRFKGLELIKDEDVVYV
jgi:DNA polymerase elongation subunit (family B)